MKTSFFALLFIIGTTLFAQNTTTEKYHRARIYYKTKADLNKLTKLGLALDHGNHRNNLYIESDFLESQIEAAKKIGSKVEIIINDMEQFYRDRNDPKSARYISVGKNEFNEDCPDAGTSTDYKTPVNYNNGSMGGYLTYEEMLQELDDMKNLYPNLISSRTGISSYTTYEGRTIQFVKISDNPSTNEMSSESQVLYTAIHHAREAASLQQTIFYMWYLLENYATSPEIKAIVDNSELFFVPCVNPDGYIYNETTNPNGGGLWRKNRRQNSGNSKGVDLNRNYSYITPAGNEVWNTAGTSGSIGDTYAGTAPFSEPETQAIRWLVEQNDFKVSLNAHSSGDLLLLPFGYADDKKTDDHSTYVAISDFMVTDNNFDNKIASELYAAAGDSDDFMYGMLTKKDGSTRNKIYAMTPEIGSSFWPPASQTISVCKSMMFLNIAAAQIAGNTANLRNNSTSIFIEDITSSADYEIERIGIDEPANFIISINPVSSNITSVGSSQNQNALALMEKRSGSIAINLNPAISQGEDVIYDIVLNNGAYDKTIRVSKKYGTAISILEEPGNDTTTYWDTTNWGVSTTQYNSATSSITDSPSGNYSNNQDKSIQLDNALDLKEATNANLSFYAKWDIENNYDYVQIEVSKDNGASWIPQCGNYTNTGVSDQSGANNEPLYDGTQNDWVLEEIDLSDYLDDVILIRFRLISDGGVVKDGFYFDDLKVKIIDSSLSTVDYISNNFSIHPNPVVNVLQINSRLTNYNYEVYSIQGQKILSKKNNSNLSIINCSNLATGMYLLKITQNGKSNTFKFIKN